jgi:hypothetical protein
MRDHEQGEMDKFQVPSDISTPCAPDFGPTQTPANRTAPREFSNIVISFTTFMSFSYIITLILDIEASLMAVSNEKNMGTLLYFEVMPITRPKLRGERGELSDVV